METNNPKETAFRAAVDTAVIMGCDQHAGQVTVCRQFGWRLPQPPQKLQEEQLLKSASELIARGYGVYTCYEAGPCGYGLHRKLTALGAINYVVAPQRWNDGRRVKNDRRDAQQLCRHLRQYVDGDTDAFSVVRVPTPEQEQIRAVCRQRKTLLRERQRCELRGHGLMLAQGHRAPPGWWEPGQWRELAPHLPAWLRDNVARWQEAAVRFDAEMTALDPRIAAMSAGVSAPLGLGALSYAQLKAEILDWGRFNNRRQPGSYSGLCPGEDSTDKRRRQLSINKHGNPEVRRLLVEAVWRMLQWQPDYPPLAVVRATRPHSRARKRAVVAAARRLMVDLWRLYTQRQTPEQLHLRMTVL